MLKRLDIIIIDCDLFGCCKLYYLTVPEQGEVGLPLVMNRADFLLKSELQLIELVGLQLSGVAN